MDMSLGNGVMPKIALVLPVYRAIPYLQACLDSILAQTYGNFTVFAIDDGSPDASGKVLDEYAVRDSRIRVTHQANAGIGRSRNAGLALVEESGGFDYVGFIDNDDVIAPEYLERFVQAIRQWRPDVVFCCFQRFTKSGRVKTDQPLPVARNPYSRQDLADRYVQKNGWAHPYMPRIEIWAALYAVETVRGFRFEGGFKTGGEDTMFSRLILPRIDRVVYVDEVLYFWRQRKSSASHMFDENPDFSEALQMMQGIKPDRGGDPYEREKCNRLVSNTWGFLRRVLQSGKPFPAEDFRRLREFIQTRIGDDELDKRRRRYRKWMSLPLVVLKWYVRFFRISSDSVKKVSDFFD